MAEERSREWARVAVQQYRAAAAMCSQKQARHGSRPLRTRVGRWLIASGRYLAGDGE